MRISLIAALSIAAIAALAALAIQSDMFPAALAGKSPGTIVENQAHAAAAAGPQSREYLPQTRGEQAFRAGLLPAGTQSLLASPGRMRHGDFAWNDDGIPPGPLTIWVDLRTQVISVFRGGHEIGTAVIVYGAESMESPLGRFPILSKHRDYHSRAYDAPMPYSLFITDTGVALHGSPMSSRRATHGCIGLPTEFARLLFAAAEKGDMVEVVRSDSHSATAALKR